MNQHLLGGNFDLNGQNLIPKNSPGREVVLLRLPRSNELGFQSVSNLLSVLSQ